MRTTFRVIAAAFALLLATPALGASEFDIANAEHDANGGTNGAKRTTIVDSTGTSAISATAGVKANLVDAAGDTLADATANAVKTVVVDSAGAALVGGRGSRVELLASGTSTSLVTGAVTLTTITLPAWAHSYSCGMIIRDIVGAGLANAYLANVHIDPVSAAEFAGTYTNITNVVASPVANNAFVLDGGPNAMLLSSSGTITGNVHSTAHGSTYSAHTRSFRLFRGFSAAPATSLNIHWWCYASGG
jgi:hypothetical protein